MTLLQQIRYSIDLMGLSLYGLLSQVGYLPRLGILPSSSTDFPMSTIGLGLPTDRPVRLSDARQNVRENALQAFTYPAVCKRVGRYLLLLMMMTTYRYYLPTSRQLNASLVTFSASGLNIAVYPKYYKTPQLNHNLHQQIVINANQQARTLLPTFLRPADFILPVPVTS